MIYGLSRGVQLWTFNGVKYNTSGDHKCLKENYGKSDQDKEAPCQKN